MVLNRIEIIFLIVLLCLVLLTYSREEHAHFTRIKLVTSVDSKGTKVPLTRSTLMKVRSSVNNSALNRKPNYVGKYYDYSNLQDSQLGTNHDLQGIGLVAESSGTSGVFRSRYFRGF